MYQLVEIVVTKYLNVESTDVHSVVTEVLVKHADKECLGKHEVSPLPCYAVGPYSCKRMCGRTLDCQNHTCKKECHKVTEIDSCTTKNKMLRIKCHCKITSLYVECRKITTADVNEKNLLSCCKNQCPKEELQCSKVRENQISIECDTTCKEMKRKASEIKEAEAKAALEEEKRRQQLPTALKERPEGTAMTAVRAAIAGSKFGGGHGLEH
ncbi:hypothetical protein CB1_000854021 [Camelus ferus]|nr:hypothetical protein CB1_000854021 [Camelus ferus]